MTLGFLADTLDLSRFPAPQAVKGVDFEAIFADTMADLVARLAAVGITLDTGNLESEPAAILMQAQAYREMLAKADMNDRVRSVLVAFATGANLDHLAAYFGVRRMVVDVETAESDEALRRRVLLAPEAFASAGPQAAWLFHALSADARVLNADVWSPAPGSVTVAIQARGGDGTADEDLIEIVRAHLSQPHIKPLTDSLGEAQLAAALSFHYNTGAILRADWVTSFRAGAISQARAQFMNWRKPASIIGRREKERDLFFDNKWSGSGKATLWPVKKPSYRPDWSRGSLIDITSELQGVAL